MTFEEYIIRLRSASLREIDSRKIAFEASWLQRAVNAVDKDGKTYIFSELKDLINFEAVEAALRGEPSENAAIDSRKQALIDERDKYVAYIKKLKADKAREGIIVDEKWLNSRGLSDVE